MIAVFDSGFGGLTVLDPLIKAFPEYDYVYLGDNARAPYGNHSKDTIIEYSRQAVEYLFNRGAKLIIFACNTASALALRELQIEFLDAKNEQNRKILGVVRPLAESAERLDFQTKLAIVATRATINSKAYDKEISERRPDIKIISKACPLLVPMIEEGFENSREIKTILKKYLLPLKNQHPDLLFLACTHYPIIKKHFTRIMGKHAKIVDAGEETVKSLRDYLARHPEIESKLTKNSTRTFLTTEHAIQMQKFIEKHFDFKIKEAIKVKIN